MLTLPAGPATFSLTQLAQFGGLHFSQQNVSVDVAPDDPPELWKLEMTSPGGGILIEDPVKQVMEVEDLVLVLGYAWK